MSLKLSDRELGVVRALIGGHSAPKIAKEFGLSLHTIKNHIRHIRLKTDSKTIAEAVVKVVKAIESNN